ncbi:MULTISPECIES: CopG family ribbon-helix-helix protein [Piscirickettsiaceae]|jgi:CopG family nickel-responsive transcriptional regulator|uniref:Ribbon-helix-helix protein, CopG family n=1 Tax=Hydrogenovibrio thermophilus TaxID=265883 RepID=A0A410H4R3_9GAMM|nr:MULTISPECIES: ribbon-helix-helix protein, CopG family [Piscirickettsiaceae]AZR81407.1 CopG family transcriptional regulator [Thiomicrospira sp. S5]AZR81576.1 CopG family transcriptional regulator [Thiomicrospira sp. S5]QAB15909.1 ribbon-helix-helix protein, CopG family [Hydrogenovibrio thermophilus]
MTQNNKGLVRTSASLPAKVLEDLDQLVIDRGFNNRSALLAEMIQKEVSAYRQDYTNEVMAGTLTLVYDHAVPGLQVKLNQLKHQYVAEIISSTQIQLMDHHTLEVNLMQGAADQLNRISHEMISNRGVKTGNLYLTHSALPPIHTSVTDSSQETQND